MTEQNGVERSSATDELRRLLDERGVKWGATDTHRLLVTSWNDASGHSWAFTEHRDGGFSKLTAYHLTPEQAVAATLGGGECECDGTIEWQWTGPTTYYEHELSCGHVIISVDNEPPKFCEECGAKVRKAVKR